MSDRTDSPFPAIAERVIGAGLVQTTAGRDLHGTLGVGRDFTTWIERRIAQYGFVENVDYVVDAGPAEGVFPRSGENHGGRPRKEYHLTLDMAKELSMVENNERGRAIRRYFIEMEKRAHEVAAIDMNAIGGMVKGIVAKQLREIIPALVREEVATRQHAVVRGLSAGQVLEMANVGTRKGLRGMAVWVSHRLRRFHAMKGVAVRIATLGSSNAYVFDALTSREWLDTGGKKELEQRIAERRGQQVLRLILPTDPKGEPA